MDFNAFGWPQWLYLAWWIFGLCSTASQHRKTITVNAPVIIIVHLIVLIVLILGGFFHG